MFSALSKYDTRTRLLNAREFHQIAGRAGRAGYDTAGIVVVQAPDADLPTRLHRRRPIKDQLPYSSSKTSRRLRPVESSPHPLHIAGVRCPFWRSCQRAPTAAHALEYGLSIHLGYLKSKGAKQDRCRNHCLGRHRRPGGGISLIDESDDIGTNRGLRLGRAATRRSSVRRAGIFASR